MAHWEKAGHIYTPSGETEWSRSHAQVPTVLKLNDDTLRIYYATRDSSNRSHISYIDVESDNPSSILNECKSPVLAPGKIGTFDDCGVMPSSLVVLPDCIYMYYIGWNVRNTVPFHNSIGLAVSKDNGATFERFSDGPLYGRTWKEPYFTGTSWVLVEDDLWRNWYMSCTEWCEVNGIMEPRYHIKYAESSDGINWKRDAKVAIDYKNEEEGGIVRACVLKNKDEYEMWYSYRDLVDFRTNKKASYRIGYANSPDGHSWQRNDDLGLKVSDNGWDSQMTAYPCVVEVKDKRYMFYNGNGFGESGIGYAELKLS